MKKFNDNSNMTTPMAKNKDMLNAPVRTSRVIKADDNGELPTRIMLVKAGEWPDSCKGNLSITTSDLLTMKRNFDAGIARPGQGLGLPIDFSHNEWQQAAGWIDGIVVEGDALYADPVDWSTEGKEAILGKMFKCISPSFYPSGRGGWQDPENLEVSIDNVLVGAGLTNIPFFKGLSPVKASSFSDDDNGDNMIYIKPSVKAKEKKEMTLDELRVKASADLTADEKKFLADNKAQLSADERVKFGFEQAPAQVTAISDADAQILADIRSGKLQTVSAADAQVMADQMAQLKASEEEAAKEKAAQIVADHVKRGAIKGDQADRWVNRLLKADADERTELESDLSEIPSNANINTEIGSDDDPSIEADTRAEIAKLAAAKVTAAHLDGKTLDFVEAQKQVLAENADLAQRDRKASNIN